ncbi:MAG TPA: phage major tail protein, TP901-1 family [Terricaulis sp.]|nr:phage major tail protein, TP901-1 family [Terricaulis sp.]HRP10788.1 phage major tail protein, TP901-1 family [Terricaulis sp.]
MTGQKGRDVLIKIADGESFTTLAGIRAKTISLNARSVDGTSGESPEAWRELIAGAGVKSASVSGAGVFKDAASDVALQTAFFAQAVRNYQLVIPGFGVIEGPFLIESLDYSGDHDGEAAFAVTLASAGALSFTSL